MSTDTGLSRKSTFENDSNISYDDLSLEMDSMLGKISAQNSQEEEFEVDAADETFDESMFLPNIEVPVEKENAEAATFSTPSKDDYQVKRQPLTDRKSNKSTPFRSFNKMLKSSTKKLRSAKKGKSNYMMFDNKKLFSNKL